METLRTTRLILRLWTLADAAALYVQAQNPKIGAMCGWLPHKSVAESREIIEHILLKPHSFAICLADNQLIGSIGLLCAIPITAYATAFLITIRPRRKKREQLHEST